MSPDVSLAMSPVAQSAYWRARSGLTPRHQGATALHVRPHRRALLASEPASLRRLRVEAQLRHQAGTLLRPSGPARSPVSRAPTADGGGPAFRICPPERGAPPDAAPSPRRDAQAIRARVSMRHPSEAATTRAPCPAAARSSLPRTVRPGLSCEAPIRLASSASTLCSAAPTAGLPRLYPAGNHAEDRVSIRPPNAVKPCQPCSVADSQLRFEVPPLVFKLPNCSPKADPEAGAGDPALVEPIATTRRLFVQRHKVGSDARDG